MRTISSSFPDVTRDVTRHIPRKRWNFDWCRLGYSLIAGFGLGNRLPAFGKSGHESQDFRQRLVGLVKIGVEKPHQTVAVQAPEAVCKFSTGLYIERPVQLADQVAGFGDRLGTKRDVAIRQLAAGFLQLFDSFRIEHHHEFQRTGRQGLLLDVAREIRGSVC